MKYVFFLMGCFKIYISMYVIFNFFIVGVFKCGIIFLYYYFNQYFDIFFCEFKELNFFNIDIKRSFRILKEEYFLLFEEVKEKYIGEVILLYFMLKEVFINIKKIFLDVKIIIVI